MRIFAENYTTMINKIIEVIKNNFFVTDEDCLNKAGKIYVISHYIIAGLLISGIILLNIFQKI